MGLATHWHHKKVATISKKIQMNTQVTVYRNFRIFPACSPGLRKSRTSISLFIRTSPILCMKVKKISGADLQPRKHVAGVTVAPLQGQAI